MRGCKQGEVNRSVIEINEDGLKVIPGRGDEGEPNRYKRRPKTPKEEGAGGPPGVNCYICGRRYGTSSLEIHVK